MQNSMQKRLDKTKKYVILQPKYDGLVAQLDRATAF